MTAQQKRQRLIDGYLAGESADKIARATGYALGTVYSTARLLRRHGFDLPDRRALRTSGIGKLVGPRKKGS